MPTSFINQEAGSDSPPTALLHRHTHRYKQLVYPLKWKGNTHTHQLTHTLIHEWLIPLNNPTDVHKTIKKEINLKTCSHTKSYLQNLNLLFLFFIILTIFKFHGRCNQRSGNGTLRAVKIQIFYHVNKIFEHRQRICAASINEWFSFDTLMTWSVDGIQHQRVGESYRSPPKLWYFLINLYPILL